MNDKHNYRHGAWCSGYQMTRTTVTLATLAVKVSITGSYNFTKIVFLLQRFDYFKDKLAIARAILCYIIAKTDSNDQRVSIV